MRANRKRRNQTALASTLALGAGLVSATSAFAQQETITQSGQSFSSSDDVRSFTVDPVTGQITVVTWNGQTLTFDDASFVILGGQPFFANQAWLQISVASAPAISAVSGVTAGSAGAAVAAAGFWINHNDDDGPGEVVADPLEVETVETKSLIIDTTTGDVIEICDSPLIVDLTVHFQPVGGGITVGDAAGDDMSFDGVQILRLAQESNQTVDVLSDINLSDEVQELFISTQSPGGGLTLTDGAVSAVTGLGALRSVTVSGDGGLLNLGANGDFLDAPTALENFSVSSSGTDVFVGGIGSTVPLTSLDILLVETSDGGTVTMGPVDASGSNLTSFEVLTADPGGPAPIPFSVWSQGLDANRIDLVGLHAGDGGLIELDNQSYTVGAMTFSGSGDIRIQGGPGGFVQQGAANAGGHSGDRRFVSGLGDDRLFGSNRDDTILVDFKPGHTNDVIYFDAGGADILQHTSTTNAPTFTVFDDGSASLTDTGTATNDDYLLIGMLGAGVNAHTRFFVGGGNDQLTLNTGGILVDFADRDSGTLQMDAFTRNLGAIPNNDTMSFDGMMTSGGTFIGTTAINLNGAISPINDLVSQNTYVLANGDAPAGGPPPFFGTSINSYLDMGQVAAYLDAVTQGSAVAGDINIFVINNLTTSVAVGDERDAYVYAFADDGGGAGIQAGEVELLSFLDSNAALTANDVV